MKKEKIKKQKFLNPLSYNPELRKDKSKPRKRGAARKIEMKKEMKPLEY